MADQSDDAKIQFGDQEIPAYEAWSKLEIATQALEVLSRFNREKESLSTELTRETEKKVRKRLGEIEVTMPKAPKKTEDLVDAARALLMAHAPEDVIDILQREHNVECDINGLIHLAGPDAYLQSLANEADTLRNNAISYDQIAELWNDARRPVPGKPFWDKYSVRDLLENTGA